MSNHDLGRRTITNHKMKTLALVIGHGPRLDRGAQNRNGTTELDWNTDLARRIMEKLATNPHVKAIVVNRRIENVPPISTVNDIGADFAVELHCNAFDTRASGTEMIHFQGSTKGTRLATVLLKKVVACLELPNRGVKTPFQGRGNAFLAKTRCPAVICETMFIDNDRDLAVATTKKEALATAYADGFVQYASENA